jgi:hypothetical protein
MTDPNPAVLEGVERARTITFASDSLTTMITLTETSGVFRLDGWLYPAAALRVELRSGKGTVLEHADDGGRFAFTDVPAGLVQLIVHPTAGAPVELRTAVVTPAVQL